MHITATSFSANYPVIYDLKSILEKIDLSSLFPEARPLELELGSGDGSFLIHYAAAHPERNFVGIERLLGRLRKVEKRARQRGLHNVRAIRIESSYFLNYLLPAHCVNAIHVYFPDPWPKRKHRRHRLVNEGFPWLVRRTLVEGGRIYLRTDDEDYFAQMESVFEGTSYRRIETPPELAAVHTDFQEGFTQRGIPTLSAAYELPGTPQLIRQ